MTTLLEKAKALDAALKYAHREMELRRLKTALHRPGRQAWVVRSIAGELILDAIRRGDLTVIDNRGKR